MNIFQPTENIHPVSFAKASCLIIIEKVILSENALKYILKKIKILFKDVTYSYAQFFVSSSS